MSKDILNESVEEITPSVEEGAAELSSDTASAAPEQEERLRSELEQAKDQLLRQVAEFQNYRRRMDKERVVLLQRGQIQVLEPLLTVLDDLRRSLEAAENTEAQQDTPTGPAYEALHQGVALVYQNLSSELGKLGMEAIEALGKPFDENEHEAMLQMPAPEGTEPGIVLQELQRGYRLGDRVLRHAKVIVAS